MPKHPRFIALTERIIKLHPQLSNPERAIIEGLVRVNGVIISNTRARIPYAAAVSISPPSSPLRGARKLIAALEAFSVLVAGRVALDVGSSTGGFTQALLAAGARKVYAVDAGHGQLLGSLRLDARVVNLERTNIANLTGELLPDTIDVVTVDLSYLSLARAAPQLESIDIGPGADLLALVKPMYELGLGHPPEDRADLLKAIELAVAGFERTGWRRPEAIESPVRGRRGAIEYLLHLQRQAG